MCRKIFILFLTAAFAFSSLKAEDSFSRSFLSPTTQLKPNIQISNGLLRLPLWFKKEGDAFIRQGISIHSTELCKALFHNQEQPFLQEKELLSKGKKEIENAFRRQWKKKIVPLIKQWNADLTKAKSPYSYLEAPILEVDEGNQHYFNITLVIIFKKAPTEPIYIRLYKEGSRQVEHKYFLTDYFSTETKGLNPIKQLKRRRGPNQSSKHLLAKLKETAQKARLALKTSQQLLSKEGDILTDWLKRTHRLLEEIERSERLIIYSAPKEDYKLRAPFFKKGGTLYLNHSFLKLTQENDLLFLTVLLQFYYLTEHAVVLEGGSTTKGTETRHFNISLLNEYDETKNFNLFAILKGFGVPDKPTFVSWLERENLKGLALAHIDAFYQHSFKAIERVTANKGTLNLNNLPLDELASDLNRLFEEPFDLITEDSLEPFIFSNMEEALERIKSDFPSLLKKTHTEIIFRFFLASVVAGLTAQEQFQSAFFFYEKLKTKNGRTQNKREPQHTTLANRTTAMYGNIGLHNHSIEEGKEMLEKMDVISKRYQIPFDSIILGALTHYHINKMKLKIYSFEEEKRDDSFLETIKEKAKKLDQESVKDDSQMGTNVTIINEVSSLITKMIFNINDRIVFEFPAISLPQNEYVDVWYMQIILAHYLYSAKNKEDVSESLRLLAEAAQLIDYYKSKNPNNFKNGNFWILESAIYLEIGETEMLIDKLRLSKNPEDYLFLSLAYISMEETKKAKNYMRLFFAKEKDTGISVTHAMGVLLILQERVGPFYQLILDDVLKTPKAEGPLSRLFVNQLDFLYRIGPLGASSLEERESVPPLQRYDPLLKLIKAQKLTSKQIKTLLNRFLQIPHPSLKAFFYELLKQTANRKGMDELHSYLSHILRWPSLSKNPWEEVYFAEKLLEYGEPDQAKKELDKITPSQIKALASRQLLEQRIEPLKKELEKAKKLKSTFEQIKYHLEKRNFGKAAAKLKKKGPFSKTGGVFESILAHLVETLPQLEEIKNLFAMRQYLLISESTEFKALVENGKSLPPVIRAYINEVEETVATNLAEAIEAEEEIRLLHSRLSEAQYIPLSSLKSALASLWDKAKYLAQGKNGQELIRQKNEIEELIRTKRKRAEKKQRELEEALLNRDFKKATQTLEELYALDFAIEINGQQSRANLFWKLLYFIEKEEDLSKIRYLYHRLKERARSRSPLSKELLNNAVVSGFLDLAYGQIKKFEPLAKILGWRTRIKQEYLIAKSFWDYEQNLSLSNHVTHYVVINGKREGNTIVASSLGVIDQEGELRAIESNAKNDFIIGDAYRLVVRTRPKKRERKTDQSDRFKRINSFVKIESIKSNSGGRELVFSFPDYLTKDKKETIFTQIKEALDRGNSRAFLNLERIPSHYYLEQSEQLREVLFKIEEGLPSLSEGTAQPWLGEMPLPNTGDLFLDRILGLKKTKEEDPRPEVLIDLKLESDSAQFRATLAGLDLNRFPVVPLIGPGGTGKTRVILELIQQAMKRKQLVLVTAPTHAAVDVIVEKMIEMNQESETPINFIRTGSDLDRIGQNIEDPETKKILEQNWNNRKKIAPSLLVKDEGTQKLKTGLVVAGTGTGFNERFVRALFGHKKIPYDLIIVDEAGKMSFVELLVLMSHLKKNRKRGIPGEKGKLIIAGDPAQLPPHRPSPDKIRHIKEILRARVEGEQLETIFSPTRLDAHQTSLLETATTEERVLSFKLTTARRGTPFLTALLRSVVPSYQDLMPRDNNKNSYEPTEDDSLTLYRYTDSKRGAEKKDRTHSAYNPTELGYAIKSFFYNYNLKDKHKNFRYTLNDIIFIAPYQAQLKEYDKILALIAYYFKIKTEQVIAPKDWKKIKALSAGRIKKMTVTSPRKAMDEIKRALPPEITSRRLPNEDETIFNYLIGKQNLFNQFDSSWRFPDPSLLEETVTSSGLDDIEKATTSSTIHKIQGGERKVVIFSATRSNKEKRIGFYDDKEGPAFITVALSRAKEKLVVIFDRETFSKKPIGNKEKEGRSYRRDVSNMLHRITLFYEGWAGNEKSESWRMSFPEIYPPIELETAI